MKPKRLIKYKDNGFVAVLLIVMLAISAITALTVNLWGGGNSQLAADTATSKALADAKTALLAYVVEKGRLPCPTNVTNPAILNTAEGQEDNSASVSACNAVGVSAIGLLPWRALGLASPKDAQAQCIWYAVSGNVKNGTTKTTPINANTDGAFKVRDVDGLLLAGNTNDEKSNAFAVLIAPSTALTSNGVIQNRTSAPNSQRIVCPLPYSSNPTIVAKQFLDSASVTVNGISTTLDNWNIPSTVVPAANVVTVKTFIQGFKNGSFPIGGVNDRLVWISTDEFSKSITNYAAKTFSKELTDFYVETFLGPPAKKYYPTAASAPNGACVANLHIGYLPRTCPESPPNDPSVADPWDVQWSNTNYKLKTIAPDNWDNNITYEVSTKCKFPFWNCTGTGNFLTVGNKTNIHTTIKVVGRAGTNYKVTTYTQ